MHDMKIRHAKPGRKSGVPGAVVFAGAAVLLLGACAEDEAQVHEAPEGVETIAEADRPAPDPRPERPPTTGAPPERAEAAAPAEQPWTMPESWSESPDVPAMRLATLVIDDEDGPVEVAISRFAGDVGGMLANVNRWRGQVGLPPVGRADLDGLLERFESPGFEGALLHIEGERQHMLVASLYETAADRTWFVRVLEEPDVAARVKDEVFEFAKSFSASGG